VKLVCAVQAVNNMRFSIQEHMLFLVQCYLKIESFKRTQSDYSYRFGCPASAESVTLKSVKQRKQMGNSETFLPIDCYYKGPNKRGY
jgi:hypothetical protein